MNHDYLTDLEVEKIESFCKDEAMYNAVRKVMLQGIYRHGTVQKGEPLPEPTINGAFHLAALAVENPIPDDQLGAHIRGMWAGINSLKNAFDTLKSVKVKKEEPVPSPINIAE
jgi:hypothetical protein